MFRESAGIGIEFKYRAVDAQAAPYPPLPSSSSSYFTEQAIRAGYIVPGLGTMYENFQDPLLVREATRRELEKERIREETIAKEIARRRVLEAEGSREMMLGRELALRGRGCDGFDKFSFLPGAGMGSELRDCSLGQVEGRSLEERIVSSLEERIGNRAGHEIRGRGIFPFPERNVEPKTGGSKMMPFQ